jgi:hypothetical protein
VAVVPSFPSQTGAAAGAGIGLALTWDTERQLPGWAPFFASLVLGLALFLVACTWRPSEAVPTGALLCAAPLPREHGDSTAGMLLRYR